MIYFGIIGENRCETTGTREICDDYPDQYELVPTIKDCIECAKKLCGGDDPEHFTIWTIGHEDEPRNCLMKVNEATYEKHCFWNPEANGERNWRSRAICWTKDGKHLLLFSVHNWNIIKNDCIISIYVPETFPMF